MASTCTMVDLRDRSSRDDWKGYSQDSLGSVL
jgi:hypothetical protein